MAEAFTITKENRKSFYRGARRVLWSGVLALGIAIAFGWVSLETLTKFTGGTVILAALWVASYYAVEWISNHNKKAA